MWWLLPAASAAPTVRNVPADGTFAEVLSDSVDFDVIEIDPIVVSTGIPAQMNKRVTVRGAGAGLTTLQVPDGAPGAHAMQILIDATFEDLTIDGGGVTPLLLVTNASALTLTRVTLQAGVDTAARGGAVDLQSGTLTATDTSFLDNAAIEGGAVRQWVGTSFTCERCTFARNEARGGTGDGGAIWVSNSTLTLVDSVFEGNRSLIWHGGAISVHTSTVQVDGGSFSGNTAAGVGGAIVLRTPPAALDIGPSQGGPTRFEGNTALNGGAIGCEDSSCVAAIADAVFDGDVASAAGGHLYVTDGDFTLTDTTLTAGVAGTSGGAIASVAGRLTLVRTLLCDNDAVGDGGGIWSAAPIDLRNVTALRNVAGGAGGAVIAVEGTVSHTTAIGNVAASGGAFAVHGAEQISATVLVDHLASPYAVAGLGTATVVDGATWNNTGDYDLAMTTVTSSLALGGSPFALEPAACATPIPLWQGEVVDRGAGLDRDGSPADLGATGGPDADPALWDDVDGDGVAAMWDCDDLSPAVGAGAPDCPPEPTIPADSGDTGAGGSDGSGGTDGPGTGGSTVPARDTGLPLDGPPVDRAAGKARDPGPIGCGCHGSGASPPGLLALAALAALAALGRRRLE